MIKNLCLEGGGVKGIAFGGALKVLEDKGILNNIERVAGTSAGAITAALISLGYTSKEIYDIISSTNFKDFEDDSFGVIRDAHRFFTKYGWFKGDVFKEWLSDLIEKKTGVAKLKFSQLSSFPTTKDLYVVATNLSKQRMEIFSKDTTPDMEIRDAVRMSMSIPFYFESVNYDDDIIVDGGVLHNYPIDIFDDICPLEETIGIKLDTYNEIEASRKGQNPSIEIDSFGDCIKSLVSLMLINDEYLKEHNLKRTIFIDTGNVGTTQFNLTKEEIEMLVNNGRIAAEKFFMK